MHRRIALPLALMLAACGGARFLPPETTNEATGLPCDVEEVFRTRCTSCHGATPSAGAPNSLLTYDDLAAADPYDATKTNAQGSLARMKAGTMPPGGGLSAAELSAVENWVNGGTPRGSCGTDGGTPTSDTDGGTTIADGLPCDVANLLSAKCTNCHSSPPRAGAPNALVSHADLVAKDPYDATKTNAQGSLARMKAGTMPPGGGVTAAEIASFEAWVNAGAPQGSCDGTQPDPLPDLGNTCSSGQTWSSSEGENSRIEPGKACLACHQAAVEGPRVGFLGTVYPSLKEPNRCKGSTGIVVEITGADGVSKVTATTNASGNFVLQPGARCGAARCGSSEYCSTSGTCVTLGVPYTAKVIANGRERVMAGPQTSGDCNACHSAAGSQGAPGRIVAP